MNIKPYCSDCEDSCSELHFSCNGQGCDACDDSGVVECCSCLRLALDPETVDRLAAESDVLIDDERWVIVTCDDGEVQLLQLDKDGNVEDCWPFPMPSIVSKRNGKLSVATFGSKPIVGTLVPKLAQE